MVEIIGVKFRGEGRTYSFSPSGHKFKVGDHVVVDTAQGVECCVVTHANYEVNESEIVAPLKPIVRPATADDLKKLEDNRKNEAKAFEICKAKIEKHGLDMKLINVESAFNNKKLTFNFTADDRIDFRELVRDLAAAFKTRIELRQIGVRDEARKLGGLGICGQPFCCNRFLNEFHPVSIKMAKEQNLSLNPEKISGTCGRLMCCLKYEQDAYEHLSGITPRVGSVVSTPGGVGVVTDANLLTGVIKVKPDDEQSSVQAYRREDIQVITPAGKNKKQKPQ